MIEKKYKVFIDFDFKQETEEQIFFNIWKPFEESIFHFENKYRKDMELFTIFSGNIASCPYIKFETTTKKMAVMLEKKVKKIIKKQGGFLL